MVIYKDDGKVNLDLIELVKGTQDNLADREKYVFVVENLKRMQDQAMNCSAQWIPGINQNIA